MEWIARNSTIIARVLAMYEFLRTELAVLAQAARQPAIPPVVTTDRWYYLGLALLVGAMIVAAIVAYRLWFDLNDIEDPDQPEDLLEAFKDARAAGELDDKEFERVRRRLANAAGSDARTNPRKPSPPS
jgi:hypothetical protein